MITEKQYQYDRKINSLLPDKGWIITDEIFNAIKNFNDGYTYEMFIETIKRLHSVQSLWYDSKTEKISLSIWELVHRKIREKKSEEIF